VDSEPAPVHEPDTKPTPEVSSDLVLPFEYCLVSTLVNSATPVTNVDVKSVCPVSFEKSTWPWFAADPLWEFLHPSAWLRWSSAPPLKPSVLHALSWRSSGYVTSVSCGCNYLPADGSLPYCYTLLFIDSISQNFLPIISSSVSAVSCLNHVINSVYLYSSRFCISMKSCFVLLTVFWVVLLFLVLISALSWIWTDNWSFDPLPGFWTKTVDCIFSLNCMWILTLCPFVTAAYAYYYFN